MKITKSKLKQIIQEELDEHFRERIPATRPLPTSSAPSDSPVQKIEYTEDDVEKLVAALPILQKTAPMSVMLNNLKRDLRTWAAENGREDLMDLINPSPII